MNTHHAFSKAHYPSFEAQHRNKHHHPSRVTLQVLRGPRRSALSPCGLFATPGAMGSSFESFFGFVRAQPLLKNELFVEKIAPIEASCHAARKAGR